MTRGGDQKFWISALGPPPNEFGQGVYSCLICHTWGLRPQVHEICPPQLQGGWVAAGIVILKKISRLNRRGEAILGSY